MKNDRKRKQEFLVKQILEQGFADNFSEYLRAEKTGGEDINNWTFEELETMVILFKRSIKNTNPTLALHFKLEEFDTGETEKNTFAKRISTMKKKPSSLVKAERTPVVEKAEVLDQGFFGGQTILYSIRLDELRMRSQRTEADFKWLQDTLSKEFPWVPLPPLMPRKKEAISPHMLKSLTTSKGQFLKDLFKHPQLRGSLALETFIASTKEEFPAKSKELNKYLDKHLLLERGMTKKSFDSLGKDVLSLQPTELGFVELKISSHIQNYFTSIEGQFPRYEAVIEKIERAAAEWDTDMKKLMATNSKMRDAFIELQSAALKYNTSRPIKSISNILEDSLYGSLTNFFEQNNRLLDESRKLFKQHIGHRFGYLKSYVQNVIEIIAQRNHFSLENTKYKSQLAEKKSRKLDLDAGALEIDASTCTALGLTLQEVRSSPEISRKLSFPEESIKLRRFSEVFAYVNLSVYKEMLYFEDFLMKSMIDNVDNLSLKNIDLIQRNNELWAEILSNFKDVKEMIAKYGPSSIELDRRVEVEA